jgi:hypothetical protein
MAKEFILYQETKCQTAILINNKLICFDDWVPPLTLCGSVMCMLLVKVKHLGVKILLKLPTV